ncbi:hypothetical protein DXG04_15845 [Salmonella enterica subsp. enterica]|nr:hypothetical protein DXG04_15845 [Salmonella enterica subsp. enterica]
MTEITLKNDLKQKSRDRVTVKPADFASQICNILAGQTYTLATGLISKSYRRPYTSRSCYSM